MNADNAIQKTPYDAPGRFRATLTLPAAQRGGKGRVSADTRHSLAALREQRGMSYRRLAGLTGFTTGHLHDLVAGRGNAPDRRRVQQMLRSSEPNLLAHIQQIAVPFLRARSLRTPRLCGEPSLERT